MSPKTFYPRIPEHSISFMMGREFRSLKEGVFCAGEHEFTVKYIMWYIKYAYRQMGKKRKVRPSPWSDLIRMFKFWQEGFNNQDTRVICLEIFQKYLFDQQVKLLNRDISTMQRYASPKLLDMVTEGLYFNEETEHCGNGHIRMMFLDVLTRRFLLRSNVILQLIQKGSNRQSKILEFMTMPLEEYGKLKWLPKEFLATTFMEDDDHMHRIDCKIKAYLNDFDRKWPDPPSEQEVDPNDPVIQEDS